MGVVSVVIRLIFFVFFLDFSFFSHFYFFSFSYIVSFLLLLVFVSLNILRRISRQMRTTKKTKNFVSGECCTEKERGKKVRNQLTGSLPFHRCTLDRRSSIDARA